MGPDTRENELRALIVRAFIVARAKGKVDWRTMMLGVLKNRLLDSTGRAFKETDYGAKTMRELVESVPDLLDLGEGSQPFVTIRPDVATELAGDASDNASHTQAAEPEPDETVEFQAVLDRYRTNGDNLGVGEAYATRLSSVADDDVEWTLANIVSRWASSAPVDVEINGIGDLVANIDKFDDETLAAAVVHAITRLDRAHRRRPAGLGDLTFRVAASLRSKYRLPAKTKPEAAMQKVIARTTERHLALVTEVDRFCKTKVGNARLPSIDVIKRAHDYRDYALAGEQGILRDVEGLLGTLFRKFCESCEKYEGEQIPMRARDLRALVQRTMDSLNDGLRYRLEQLVLEPVAHHVFHLIDEGTRTSEEMMMPSVRITGEVFKLDLAGATDEVVFPVRMVNQGDGTARSIRIGQCNDPSGTQLSASEPSAPFDLAPGTERLVRLRLGGPLSEHGLELPTTVECETVNDRRVSFEQTLVFQQQRTQPDWDELLRSPPYRTQADSRRKGPVWAGFDPVRSRVPCLERDVDLSLGSETGGQDLCAAGSGGETKRTRRCRLHRAEDGRTRVAARGANRPHDSQSARARTGVGRRGAVGGALRGRLGPVDPLHRGSGAYRRPEDACHHRRVRRSESPHSI